MTQHFRHCLRMLLATAMPITLLLPVSSVAAADAGDAAAPGTNGIEEIVVVADKRDVRLQKVPLSITALTADTLSAGNILSPVDLNGFVPGLTVARNEGNTRIASIRGIGLEANQNIGAQPGVAYHIDGVYIADPLALNTDFLDVARIDVLRGPQGTVFGQNATGGTINVISNKPQFDQESGYANLSVGNYSLVKTEMALNLPLSDRLAVRGAFLGSWHDGFAKATKVPGYPNGFDLDNENAVNGRFVALWRPADNFSLEFGATIANEDENDRAQKSIFDPNPDPRELTQDYPGKFGLESQVYSLTATWDLGGITIKDIASYQALTNEHSWDRDRLTYALSEPHDLNPVGDRDEDFYTEELNISSNSEGPFNWIAGGFYLSTHQKVCELEVSVTPGQFVPTDCVQLQKGVSIYDIAFQSNSVQTRQSYSLYGQGTYEFTDTLRLTAGARYTLEEIGTTVSDYYNAYGPPTHAGVDNHAVTGKVSLEDDLTPTNMVYATVSSGFKPGGSNLSQTPILVPVIYKPERVNAYEIGSKNRFADNTLQLNVSAFYYFYRGLQIQADDPVPFQGGVGNVDKSEVYGLEIEGSALLPWEMRLDGNFAAEQGTILGDQKLLDGYEANFAQLAAMAQGYGTFSPQTIAARAAAARKVGGNDLPKLPSVTGSLILTKEFDLGDYGNLKSRVAYVYRGAFQARVFNDPAVDDVPAYYIFNLNFQYSPSSGPWSLEFAVDNVTDRGGVSSKFIDAFATATDSHNRGAVTEEYIPPRQFILTGRYRF